MERIRMVGDYELVYENNMKMYRIMKKDTEEFSDWYSSEEAEELKEMKEDEFFSTAEKSIKKFKNSRPNQ